MIDIAGGIILAVIGLYVVVGVFCVLHLLGVVQLKIVAWLYDSNWGRTVLALGLILVGIAVVHLLTPAQ